MKNENDILEETVRLCAALSQENKFSILISILVEQALDISKSELAGLYLYPEGNGNPKLVYKRGWYSLPAELSRRSELINFAEDCGETIVLLNRKASPFSGVLLDQKMNSGIILPLNVPTQRLGYLVLNSDKADFYRGGRFRFLESISKFAGGLLHNSVLYSQLQDHLRKIEAMERYQQSIFTSMSDLLITTSADGKIRYFNEAAERKLKLTEENLGQNLDGFFKKKLTPKVLRVINEADKNDDTILGLEGILKIPDGNIDYSLNITQLKGKRGAHEGLTLLFKDQSAEKEMKDRMKVAIEERRMIKDMFSRYLSNDIINHLMESPGLVSPGGSKKTATVFFADIRGYTAFSETKEPEVIIDILNEYFTEAVEIVINHGGYIDKFIGDCIMAAWGVPLSNEKEDAKKAVKCAVEIQRLVASKTRKFFRGQAESLKIGIGMHSGPLVAGNLGSSRRMDYSMIGDTVNLAARLEGVAGPNEIIITGDTRNMLDDSFNLEKRKPVTVKGKKQPIEIFNVAV
ncbi:MAG: adenylate/guanylate cyclase domain-containing protein [Spirochaetales bacterium]|uniref:Adenylate/guanylate cyclase domain-containing protein n=1 Tax=Candidatus Thalassospirochaeta sargassi TaxID=3119039 RepID=A0AAJ1IEZ6_9SPIO|nr:adenylate/guanylate cyclase domain-containing protein [Spirochaetales bacterium]